MNIIHIWDQAGVACVLAKYQSKQGHSSHVIISKPDKFGIYDFYKKFVISVLEKEFQETCLTAAGAADVVHIHSRIDMVDLIRSRLGKEKKIILHYHGTDIRGLRGLNLPHESLVGDLAFAARGTARKLRDGVIGPFVHDRAQKLSDVIFVSTPDLSKLVPKSLYFPNPADTEHFTPTGTIAGRKKEPYALMFETEITDTKLAIQHSTKKNLPCGLKIHDRTREPIKYADMPAFLRKYQMYADFRFVNGTILENLSKTALEALSCGVPVIDYKLDIITRLPAENNPNVVAEKLAAIYKAIKA